MGKTKTLLEEVHEQPLLEIMPELEYLDYIWNKYGRGTVATMMFKEGETKENNVTII